MNSMSCYLRHGSHDTKIALQRDEIAAKDEDDVENDDDSDGPSSNDGVLYGEHSAILKMTLIN